MAKLDSDVRNVIHHLYFRVSDTWNVMSCFLFSPDTVRDAALWIEKKPGTGKVQLKQEIAEFVIQADAQMKELPGSDFVLGYPLTDRPRQPGEPRPVFLAMPTKDWLPDVVRTIRSASKGFRCVLSVDNAAPGDIMSQVWREIRYSDAVIADLTGQNPNVFYEMGLAHALGKTVIMIKQTGTIVPFDLSNYRHTDYDLGKLKDLKVWLANAFRSLPDRYSFD